MRKERILPKSLYTLGLAVALTTCGSPSKNPIETAHPVATATRTEEKHVIIQSEQEIAHIRELAGITETTTVEDLVQQAVVANENLIVQPYSEPIHIYTNNRNEQVKVFINKNHGGPRFEGTGILSEYVDTVLEPTDVIDQELFPFDNNLLTVYGSQELVNFYRDLLKNPQNAQITAAFMKQYFSGSAAITNTLHLDFTPLDPQHRQGRLVKPIDTMGEGFPFPIDEQIKYNAAAMTMNFLDLQNKPIGIEVWVNALSLPNEATLNGISIEQRIPGIFANELEHVFALSRQTTGLGVSFKGEQESTILDIATIFDPRVKNLLFADTIDPFVTNILLPGFKQTPLIYTPNN